MIFTPVTPVTQHCYLHLSDEEADTLREVSCPKSITELRGQVRKKKKNPRHLYASLNTLPVLTIADKTFQ